MPANKCQGSSCLYLPSAGHHTWCSPSLPMPLHSSFLPFIKFPGIELRFLCPSAMTSAISLIPRLLVSNVTSQHCCLMCVKRRSCVCSIPYTCLPSGHISFLFYIFFHSDSLCKLKVFRTLWKSLCFTVLRRNPVLPTVRDNWAQFYFSLFIFLLSSC